jgi:hypothetical protein
MSTWTTEQIRELLDQKPAAVYRGLKVIHSLQTATEQRSWETREHNGVGWSAYDAPLMSDLHQKVLQGIKLTDGQFNMLRNKMKRYAGQLTRIANGELRVEV